MALTLNVTVSLFQVLYMNGCIDGDERKALLEYMINSKKRMVLSGKVCVRIPPDILACFRLLLGLACGEVDREGQYGSLYVLQVNCTRLSNEAHIFQPQRYKVDQLESFESVGLNHLRSAI